MGKSQLKNGAILSYINIIISLIIGFITVPFIVKQLGTSEYGVYSLTGSLVGYISILDFGMHNVVVRYVAKYNARNKKKEQSNFLATVLIIYGIISIVVAIASFFIYNNIYYIFSKSLTIEEINISKKLFIILAINLVISLPGAVFSAIITAYEKFVFSRIITTLKMLARTLLIFTTLYLGFKSIGLVLIDLLINLIVILVSAIYCFRVLSIKIKLYNFSYVFIKTIFTYTFYVFLATISDQINWKLDSLILGMFKDSSIIAISTIGMQLISYFRSFTGAISGIFLPRATKMVALNCSNSELTDLLIRVGRYQLIIVGLLLTGFVLIGKQFIVLWVGKDFIDAYYIFLIIAFALIIPSCQSIGINILEAKNMHKFRAKLYLAISTLNAIITIFLVKQYSAIGAALGTSFSLIVGNVFIINWYYSKKVGLEIKRYFKEVYMKNGIYIVLSGFICYFLLKLINFNATWFNIAIEVLIITVVYTFIIFIKVLSKREREQVFSVFYVNRYRR